MGEPELPGVTTTKAKVDWLTGEHRKLEGQQRVLFNAGSEWHGGALLVIKEIAHGKHYITSDDFHLRAIELKLEEPHHPNATGALFKDAAQKGYIRRTSETKKSVRKRAHSREIRVWESLLWK